MHPATEALLAYFQAEHLPAGPLRETSAACRELANYMVEELPDGGAELTAGLRKLLEAKDCFVRAALPK